MRVIVTDPFKDRYCKGKRFNEMLHFVKTKGTLVSAAGRRSHEPLKPLKLSANGYWASQTPRTIPIKPDYATGRDS